MRYEKKMLILSGEGKGVVLIEKSGLGVRFALRTFGIGRASGRRAGIITPSDVFVRELPDTADPSLVFYLDGAETEPIHFAVFDSELRLYGTNGKRMWEANLMGLLRAHDRAARLSEPTPARLPPLIEKPKTLPLPDGTGLPQSRDAVYGDDALSASDFYTKLDMGERMRVVDGFLDTPRVIGGDVGYTRLGNPSISAFVAPDDEPRGEADRKDEILMYEAQHADADMSATETEESEEAAATAEIVPTAEERDLSAAQTAEASPFVENTAAQSGGAVPRAVKSADVDGGTPAETTDAKGAIANEGVYVSADRPWQYAAKYLCKMSKRAPVIEKERVRQIKPRDKVPPLRETAFFERAHGDIDKLFRVAERDDELKALLPDIEWVKVEFDGRTVSVGRASEFLCYAVAGVYEKISPLGKESQWLPRVKTAPTGKGYWLVFQDINTGEILAG